MHLLVVLFSSGPRPAEGAALPRLLAPPQVQLHLYNVSHTAFVLRGILSIEPSPTPVCTQVVLLSPTSGPGQSCFLTAEYWCVAVASVGILLCISATLPKGGTVPVLYSTAAGGGPPAFGMAAWFWPWFGLYREAPAAHTQPNY